ncbi:MAG: Fic family protein [Ginsengibacter sp.]
MHIAKEATQSSRIEGTQTSIEDAIQDAAYIDPEKKDDWQEVHNYIEAMNYAIEQLNKLPLSNRLLKQTHRKLLHGVRGKHKSPGEFRTSQNWIGGASLKDASFIPPHHNEVPELMSDLEKFLHTDLPIPHLIRIGIAHYQFETIHPFLDGNGRLGRLLITLYLVSNKIISKPALYLSDFFERNRRHYYDNLTIVRTKKNMGQWLSFFLRGIAETAQNSIDTFNAIISLRQKVENKQIIKLGKKVPLAMEFIRYLYSKPIVDTNEIAVALKINISTAHRLVQDFEKLGILKEQTGYKRNRIFIFEAYLKLFK